MRLFGGLFHPVAFLTFVKNMAMPQYSVCFQLVNGWLWHWAHWSCTPRKRRVTVSVTLSAVGLARKKVTAPFSSWVPEAVSQLRDELVPRPVAVEARPPASG